MRFLVNLFIVCYMSFWIYFLHTLHVFGFMLKLLYGGSKEAIGTTVGADVGDAVATVVSDVELIGAEVGADVGA